MAWVAEIAPVNRTAGLPLQLLMRWVVLSVSVLFLGCLGATCARAQTGFVPYGTHIDRRHGHDHEYPDRGAVVRDVPPHAAVVNYAGLSYRFAAGVWYERVGPAYIVVAPPIGLVVPRLPAFATSFHSVGGTYLYADAVFYRARPDLGGYEVVNDPQDDGASQRSQAPARASSPRFASAPRTAAQPTAARDSTRRTFQPEDRAIPPVNPTGVAIYPRRGQDADQQALDRYECYGVAVRQTGFDPLASNNGIAAADVARHNSEYSRAQAACLDGRGYTVP